MQTHNKESKFTFLQIVYFLTKSSGEHGASNAKILGSIPRESKSW